MNVLNLVTTARPFFQRQVDVLERKGVSCTTLTVPGKSNSDGNETRSLVDYLRFYPRVLQHSLKEYDLIHANYGLTAPAGLAQPTRPVVLSLWGSDLMGKYGSLSRRLARHYDKVIVMTDDMAEALDVPCHVIPHGIDMNQFRPRPQEEAQAQVGWDPEAYHVLFPYAPDRDVKDYSRAERVVAAASERLSKRVSLEAVSGVSHDRVATYMNAADVLLVTSKREGSPNAVKEALSCNLPVVSTDVGDVRERLDGVSLSTVCGNDAELVEALVAVLTSDETPDSRAAIREFSLDRMGERLIEVYRQALANRTALAERRSA